MVLVLLLGEIGCTGEVGSSDAAQPREGGVRDGVGGDKGRPDGPGRDALHRDGPRPDLAHSDKAQLVDTWKGKESLFSKDFGKPDQAKPKPDSLQPDKTIIKPSDQAICAPVTPAVSPDPWTIRHAGAGTAGVITQKNGAYTDVLLKGPADYIRIGARLEWGGTVVFFGLASSASTNVIDANDNGRELQLAVYDPTRAMQGCAYNASCQSGGTACPSSIKYLGWNPVQGGDECGNGGKVLSYGQKGQALQLVVQPMQWNPDWDRSDCATSACGAGVPVKVTYTFELRFVTSHTVEVMSQVDSQETISHPVTVQEFPTLYVSHGNGGPDLPLLLDAGGTTIALNTKANDGFYMGNFTSPGPWVAFQDSTKTYGVGLAMDQGITSWQGWRGDGTSAPYFHNVRANISFGLGAGKTVRGISYLALGNFSTVKAELQGVLAKRPPFGVLDLPAAGTVAYSPGAAIGVSGWVLDTKKPSQVKVLVDGAQVTTLSVNQSRSDVCAVYPAYDGCPTVGYAGQVSTQGLSACPHLLQVTATDSDGNTTVLGERKLQPQ